jgi:hypothetical protein
LQVARVQVQHEHRTGAVLITNANEQGYWDVINAEEIEEAEYEIVKED